MAKRKELTADEIIKQMYPDIMTSDDAEEAERVKAEAAAKAAAAPDTSRQVQELQAQLARLEGQLSSVQRPVEYQQTQAPQRPIVNYDSAPDPLTDPKGYAQFVNQSTQALVDYEKQAWAYNNRQAELTTNRTQGLWDKFSSTYGEYAKNDDRVRIATQQVLERAKSRGDNLDDLMYKRSDDFLKSVVGEIDKLWGKPQAGQDDDDEGDEGDTIDNRTAVLSGSGGGQGGPAKVQPQAQKFGALSQDINAWQQKTGFYR